MDTTVLARVIIAPHDPNLGLEWYVSAAPSVCLRLSEALSSENHRADVTKNSARHSSDVLWNLLRMIGRVEVVEHPLEESTALGRDFYTIGCYSALDAIHQIQMVFLSRLQGCGKER